MKHAIRLAGESLWAWLFARDGHPTLLPVFPKDPAFSLVVVQLFADRVYANVLPTRAAVSKLCGRRIILGRLYFQVPKTDLFAVCPDLTNSDFEPN